MKKDHITGRMAASVLMLCLAVYSFTAMCEAGIPPIVQSLDEMDAPLAALCHYAEEQRVILLEDFRVFSKKEVNLSVLEEVGFEDFDAYLQEMIGRQPKNVLVMVAQDAMDRQPNIEGKAEIQWDAFAPGAVMAFGDSIHAATTNKYLANVLDRLCLFDLARLDEIPFGGFSLANYGKDLPQVLTSVYRMNDEYLLTRTQMIYPNPSTTSQP